MMPKALSEMIFSSGLYLLKVLNSVWWKSLQHPIRERTVTKDYNENFFKLFLLRLYKFVQNLLQPNSFMLENSL